MPNIIFNADDFGISAGVNQAIYKAHTEGVLNSTSIMITLKYVSDALNLAKKMPNLNIGLHANLTNESSILSSAEIPLLVDENGKFKHGFVNLAILSVLHPRELKRQAKAEIKAQIDKALSYLVNYLSSGICIKCKVKFISCITINIKALHCIV